MKSIICIFILLLNCLAQAAVISLPVPRSKIQFATPELAEQKRPVYFRLGMTSWAPSSFRKSSRLSNTTEFKPMHGSHIQFEIGKEFYSSSSLLTRSSIGLSYGQFERTGELNNGSAITHYSEILNVFQFPVSLELLGQMSSIPKFHPLFKVGLSPVYSRAPSGPFSNGVSEINWLAKSSFGFSFDLASSSFAVGLERSHALDTSSLSGEGVWISLGLNWQ